MKLDDMTSIKNYEEALLTAGQSCLEQYQGSLSDTDEFKRWLADLEGVPQPVKEMAWEMFDNSQE